MPAIEAASQGLPLLIRKGTAPDDFFRQGLKPGFQFTSLDEIPALIEEIVKDYDYYSEQANKLASLYTFEIYEKNLLGFTKQALFSKNMLQAILDMQPFVIVASSFMKQSLIDLGFKPSSIYILPLYHKLPIQRHTLSAKAKPKLLTLSLIHI